MVLGAGLRKKHNKDYKAYFKVYVVLHYLHFYSLTSTVFEDYISEFTVFNWQGCSFGFWRETKCKVETTFLMKISSPLISFSQSFQLLSYSASCCSPVSETKGFSNQYLALFI